MLQVRPKSDLLRKTEFSRWPAPIVSARRNYTIIMRRSRGRAWTFQGRFTSALVSRSGLSPKLLSLHLYCIGAITGVTFSAMEIRVAITEAVFHLVYGPSLTTYQTRP